MVLNMEKGFNVVYNFTLISLTLLNLLFLENSYESLKYIGISILIVSFFTLYKYRKNTNISLLIGILMLISISFATSVCLNTQDTAFNWQIPLINTSNNIINAKNFLLFITILSISMGNIKEKKNITYSKKNNIFIAGACILLLFIILFCCFDRSIIGQYVSNSNPLYEYALIVYLIAWYYSKDIKILKIILIIYAICYCTQGLLFGDRSSAFPMLLLNFMLIYKRKYNIFKVILIGLIGIFLANIFDIFRTSGTLSFDVLKEVINRGLFVNTISYSFYAGTQIINYGQTIVNTKVHLIDYIIAIFLGKSSNLDLASLALNAGFVNKGGGMTHAYLYFWNGYIGTLIFSFIIGKIITKIFNSDKNYAIILRVTITIFSIRWIVYFPIALFRTAIFVPLLCFTITEYFNDILNKRQNKYLKVSERSDNNE